MAKRKYRVKAPTAVLDHEPDETFEADLDPVQEARLLAAGALAVETEAPKPLAGKPVATVTPDPSE